jgi:AcrR family transcriptional regulator
VIDICDRAMVHRTTFYKHFEDKYDLIRYCIKNLEESFKSAGLKDHDPANPRTFYLNTIRLVLRYFIEHKRLILVLANRGQSDTVLAMVHDLISADVQQKLKKI